MKDNLFLLLSRFKYGHRCQYLSLTDAETLKNSDICHGLHFFSLHLTPPHFSHAVKIYPTLKDCVCESWQVKF